MCSGFEPLLFEAGGEALAGDMFLGDMAATGAGEGLAGMGAAEGAGALGAADAASSGSFLGDMAATGAGEGATAGGLGSEAMGAMGASGGGAANYLESLGGMDTLTGSQFAESMAPFTQGMNNVSAITNAVPELGNVRSLANITAAGAPTAATETLPGLSQASNFTAGANYGAPTAPGYGSLADMGAVTQGAGTSLAAPNISTAGLASPSEGFFAGATPTAGTSAFSLENMMSNPMGMAKSAYDKISNNPVPSMYAAGSLYDMYAKNKMATAQQGMYNQNRADIMNTYAPGSPEYNLLAQQIARKDAAAGRNSQYGTRANELAGTIAKLRMNALGGLQQGQNALGNQALSNQYGMFNTPLALAMYSNKTAPTS